jgi:hypothetical protein
MEGKRGDTVPEYYGAKRERVGYTHWG